MIERITPRKLNKDTDERSLKPTELKDAMNVSVGIDSEGDSGVLKLADGNEYVSLSDAMASIDGVKTVIGSAEDEELGVIYFFTHNSNGNHAIFAYSSKTNTYRLIFSHPSLNFSSTGFVKGDVVRVKRRFSAEAASILGEQGDDGGAIDFGVGGDDPVFTDPAIAIEINLVRDLLIFEELAKNVYSKPSFQEVFNASNDWEMVFYATLNDGLATVNLYSSEEDANIGLNPLGEVTSKANLSFEQIGVEAVFNYGKGTSSSPELWIKSSDLNDETLEIFVEMRYVGEPFETIGSEVVGDSFGAGGFITVQPNEYSEIVYLSGSDFIPNTGNIGNRQADIDPSTGFIYNDYVGPGLQKVFGKPEKNRMEMTVDDVFAHPMLPPIAFGSDGTTNGTSWSLVRNAMRQLGQYEVQTDGTALQVTSEDPLLTDRSTKVSMRVGFGGLLKEYTEEVTRFAESISNPGSGPDGWYSGPTSGPGLRSLDTGSTDDGGGSPTASNIYAAVWCPSTAAFKIYYCKAASFVPTSSNTAGGLDYTWNTNWVNAYAEVYPYCYGPQTTVGINAAAENWVRVTTDYETDINPDPLEFQFAGAQEIEGGLGFTGWVELQGEFPTLEGVSKSQGGQILPLNMKDMLNIHHEQKHGVPGIDPSTGQFNFWVVLINSDDNDIGGIQWNNCALAYDPFNDGSITRQFYMDHFPVSNVLYEDFPAISNISTFAQETSPEYLNQIGIDETSLNYISYIASLPYLTYNINYVLGFAMTDSFQSKRAAIVNYDWDGRSSLQAALELKVEPINSSLGNETGLKAFAIDSLGNEITWSEDVSKQIDNQPSNSISPGELNYQVTLTNGESNIQYPYRGVFVPIKRFQGEDDYVSQHNFLNPLSSTSDAYQIQNFTPCGDLRLGAYNDDNPSVVQPFGWGTNVAEANAAGLPTGRTSITSSDAALIQEQASESSEETGGSETSQTSQSSPQKDSSTPTDTSLSITSKAAKRTIRKKY